MKSIKPGRGPSMMGGIAGIAVAIFGVIWTITAASSGAPPFFAIFGIFFVIFALIGAVYNLRNATGKNRHSTFDIVDAKEEPDPWNVRASGGYQSDAANTEANSDAFSFCPYCGEKLLDAEFEFCPKCGKKLP